MPATARIATTHAFIRQKALEVQRLTDQAGELQAQANRITQELFVPLGVKPGDLLSGAANMSKVNAGKANVLRRRAGKGELRDLVLTLIDKSPNKKITSDQAVSAFKQRGIRTAAYVTLSRMEKDKLLKSNDEQGVRGRVWTRK